jgi:glycosyltransferase involved in cell wall biosynthesis
VITVSAASRDDIVGELGLPADRVDVIPNGIADPAPAESTAGVVRRDLDVGHRRIALSVASAVAHKNLSALLEAVARLVPEERPLLVFAGQGTDAPAFAERTFAMGLQGDVRLLGAVGREELEGLYSMASVFVTATRYEGFGLPVLEAARRGVPVVCSDLPVLREVAGPAAIYVDPTEPGAIAAAVRRVLMGGPEIERFRAAGRAQASRFTWRAAAEATLVAYDRALEVSRARPRRTRGWTTASAPRRDRSSDGTAGGTGRS